MVNSVVVVLGAALDNQGNPSPALIRRMQTGCDLAQERAADLLVTGGLSKPSLNITEAQAMKAFAKAQGLTRVFLEDRALNTLENAAFSQKIIQDQGWQEIVIVTQKSHILRAKLSFQSCGIKAHYYAAQGCGDKFVTFFSALREVPALIWYALRVLNGHPKQLMTRR